MGQNFLSLPRDLSKIFFKENQTLLEGFYPGINPLRIERELNDWLELKGSGSAPEFFNLMLSGIPLEYISGHAWFFRSEFLVSPDVLIPRSETEILVELGLLELSSLRGIPRVADIGTGSGAIILSLLRDHRGPLEAIASDISKDALKIAEQNYFRLEYTIPSQSSLTFLESDRLEKIEGEFDLIVSNPPYIMEKLDAEMVHSGVKKHEPHLALYLKDEEYQGWFDLFFQQVKKHLKPSGLFIMEGHEHHLESLAETMKKFSFCDVQIKIDYNGLPRFIVARI